MVRVKGREEGGEERGKEDFKSYYTKHISMTQVKLSHPSSPAQDATLLSE